MKDARPEVPWQKIHGLGNPRDRRINKRRA